MRDRGVFFRGGRRRGGIETGDRSNLAVINFVKLFVGSTRDRSPSPPPLALDGAIYMVSLVGALYHRCSSDIFCPADHVQYRIGNHVHSLLWAELRPDRLM